MGRQEDLEEQLASWHMLLAAAVAPVGHPGRRGELGNLRRRRLWREAAEKSRDSPLSDLCASLALGGL